MTAAAWTRWPLPKPEERAEVDMWVWQKGHCAWCGRKAGDRLVLDHCHATGLIRGYLCRSCNSVEGWSSDPIWDGWRAGDNPAAALKEFEVYVNRYGQTPIGPYGALAFYSPSERRAWFRQIVGDLEAGAPWPEDAPWTDEARERKVAQDAALRAALSRMDFGLDRTTGAAS